MLFRRTPRLHGIRARTVRQRGRNDASVTNPYRLHGQSATAALRVGEARIGSRSGFSHWSIERRVLVGFGLVFAGIVVISAISYRNTAVLIENSRLDTKSHELVQLLGSVEEALDAAESGHRRYLVTGDESYSHPTGPRRTNARIPSVSQRPDERGSRTTGSRDDTRTAHRQAIGHEAGAISPTGEAWLRRRAPPRTLRAAKNELDGIHRLMTELESCRTAIHPNDAWRNPPEGHEVRSPCSDSARSCNWSSWPLCTF